MNEIVVVSSFVCKVFPVVNFLLIFHITCWRSGSGQFSWLIIEFKHHSPHLQPTHLNCNNSFITNYIDHLSYRVTKLCGTEPIYINKVIKTKTINNYKTEPATTIDKPYELIKNIIKSLYHTLFSLYLIRWSSLNTMIM